MLTFMKQLGTSSSGMAAQGERLRVVSENVANAHTPGYRRKLLSFTQEVDRQTGAQRVEIDRLTLDRSPLERVLDPDHPLADEAGYVDMSNVEILVEIADAADVHGAGAASRALLGEISFMHQRAIIVDRVMRDLAEAVGEENAEIEG